MDGRTGHKRVWAVRWTGGLPGKQENVWACRALEYLQGLGWRTFRPVDYLLPCRQVVQVPVAQWAGLSGHGPTQKLCLQHGHRRG